MGGRKQSSAIDAVMAMVHDIQMAKSNNHVVSCVLLDVKGAFDYVSVYQLIHIVTRMHLPQIISWVKCFMSQRSVSLAFDGKKHQMRQIDTGIPQGSPISLILFLIYIRFLLPRIRMAKANTIYQWRCHYNQIKTGKHYQQFDRQPGDHKAAMAERN